MVNNFRDSLSIDSAFHAMLQNKSIFRITLSNGVMEVTTTNFGCAIISIRVPDKNGEKLNVVAGYDDIENYENNPAYFGCVIGRYANRVAGGKFSLNNQEIKLSVNESGNHLHGGFNGFNKKIWNVESLIRENDRVGVVFAYLSPDGEEGYPGNLTVKVSYILNNRNQLSISYRAETDMATPVNLTNHSYFNLAGFTKPLITDHLLKINAKTYTQTNTQDIPTGKILEVEGTPLDFLIPKKIGKELSLFSVNGGLNHNFILEKHAPGEMSLAASLEDDDTGRTLTIHTDQPAIQVYTANFWDGTISGSHGLPYQKFGAIALESQAYPDSPNHLSFPDTILRPGEIYSSSTIYEFGIKS